jgi:hypothetical protein
VRGWGWVGSGDDFLLRLHEQVCGFDCACSSAFVYRAGFTL